MSMSSRQVLLPDTLQAAKAALLLPVRAVQTPTGKRVVTALALAGALQLGVTALYANADMPGLPGTAVATVAPAPAEPATAQPEATEPEATEPATAAQATEEPAAPADKAASPADKPVRPSPEEAAVAFYAAELGLDEGQLRPLAQQRVNDNTVKVLVLAERSAEDLATRHIQVNRTHSGWRVP
jgi:hypothetical protein